MKRISVVVIAALLMVGLTFAAAYAADVRGQYAYVEKGYKGTMTIKWLKGYEGRAYAFVFRTVNPSNGQSCEFEATEIPPRTNDTQPAAGESDSGAKFKISFQGDTARVNVVKKGGECGMSGFFGGTYKKVK
ncbi:MAG: hypothetical protein ABFD97_12920 [Syntrophobacter sp.]